jgi:hypothetical protein
MALLVDTQGELLDQIEHCVTSTNAFVEKVKRERGREREKKSGSDG